MAQGIIILGGGGHAKVVVDALRAMGESIIGFTDRNPDAPLRLAQGKAGIPLLGTDEAVAGHDPASVRLAMGIGSTKPGLDHAELFEQFRVRGYTFVTVIHPSAVVAEDVVLGEGCQIMAGAVIQPGCRLGAGVIVNTRASVDHDCVIGDFSHIAPGATLSGGVHIGDGCHIGAGATIVQNLSIGQGAFVRAGTVLTEHVAQCVRHNSSGEQQ